MSSAIAVHTTIPHFPSLDRVAAGAALSGDETIALTNADGNSTADLCAAASELRDRGRGRVVTFSPKVFIPLTRLCRDFCGYCTFRQSPEESDGLYLTFEEVLSVAGAGQRLGCTEALFTSANDPNSGTRRPASGWRTAASVPLSNTCRACAVRFSRRPTSFPTGIPAP